MHTIVFYTYRIDEHAIFRWGDRSGLTRSRPTLHPEDEVGSVQRRIHVSTGSRGRDDSQSWPM